MKILYVVVPLFSTRVLAFQHAVQNQARKIVAMSTKATLPDDYVLPKVWKFEGNAEKTAGSNRPTAGVRTEAKLPQGDHALQLYALGTPNGAKTTILLEELNELKGIEYDAWKINISQGDQFGSEYVDKLNPNSKIPALYDKDLQARVFESGSILMHLAEKYQAFIPTDPAKRIECFNWLFWQVGGGPSMGAFGHFYKAAPIHIEYAIDRFALEVKRQLSVLDIQLEDKQYICGNEYTIADIAIYPWILTLDSGYKGGEFLGISEYTNIAAWVHRISQRPAVIRGRRVLGFTDDALSERHSRADFDK
uniref:Glutathione S-transferase n=1 Tax=Aureoumbra lagunensis TaxID=44058 RepID=A0A7S3NP24_9STRA|mmetsp:Transcript_6991/g.9795  ORF Transcript_6991/g.9795 Transcript_6991/m.9795 type:complete len:307 (-) Transcript_6991:111-1031(-)